MKYSRDYNINVSVQCFFINKEIWMDICQFYEVKDEYMDRLFCYYYILCYCSADTLIAKIATKIKLPLKHD